MQHLKGAGSAPALEAFRAIISCSLPNFNDQVKKSMRCNCDVCVHPVYRKIAAELSAAAAMHSNLHDAHPPAYCGLKEADHENDCVSLVAACSPARTVSFKARASVRGRVAHTIPFSCIESDPHRKNSDAGGEKRISNALIDFFGRSSRNCASTKERLGDLVPFLDNTLHSGRKSIATLMIIGPAEIM